MNTKEKCVAVVTIREAAKMSEESRKAIAEWLRMHADMIVEEGHNYDRVFRGHYHYR